MTQEWVRNLDTSTTAAGHYQPVNFFYVGERLGLVEKQRLVVLPALQGLPVPRGTLKSGPGGPRNRLGRKGQRPTKKYIPARIRLLPP